MRKLQALPAALVALSFIAAFIAQPMLPERVAVHWNAEGAADGFSGRGVGAFALPILMLFMLGLFWLLPKIDPKKRNYAAFQAEYDGLVAVVEGFLLYLYLLSLAINMGHALNMVQWLSPAFAALFFYTGVLLGRAKQTWFVGIRTPWTLSSGSVWQKTHALGSKLFKAAGAVALLGAAVPQMFLASIAAAVAAALALIAYSYFQYEKERKGR